jgi:flagellar biosynthesis component FlhA
MDIFSFVWEKIIVQLPPMAVIAFLFISVVLMFIYFRAENKSMLAKISKIEQDTKTELDLTAAKHEKLRNEITLSQPELVKKTEVNLLWKELHDLRKSMESGLGTINQQLTQISAAVINAVSNK